MKRVDANQKQIVEDLRKVGFSVCVLSSVGKGVPDLLLGRWGRNFLIELKDGAKPKSKQKLTPDEITWHERWKGSVHVCNSFEEIVNKVF